MSARHTRRTIAVTLAALAIGVLGACERRSTVPKPKTDIAVPTAPAAPTTPPASAPAPTTGTTVPSAK